MFQQTPETLLELNKKSHLFFHNIDKNKATELLGAHESANCLFTSGRNQNEINFYYKVSIRNEVQIRVLTFTYSPRLSYFTMGESKESFYRLTDASIFVQRYMNGFCTFNPVLLENSEISTEQNTVVQIKIEKNIKKILERKAIVEAIFEPLFKVLNADTNITCDQKVYLNLNSSNGISFDACTKYTDNQFFIDLRLLNNIVITDLFFDGKEMDIRDFHREKNPLILSLLKKIKNNIEELCKQNHPAFNFAQS